MKHFVLILIGALLLMGCRTKKAVIDESATVAHIDTTKTTTDTINAVIAHIDTTQAIQQTERASVIEFVDSGGIVTIDTAGNIRLQGVKSVSGYIRNTAMQLYGISDSVNIAQTHTEQANGIAQTEIRHTKSQESIGKAVQWYEKPLIWIGGLCCIAVLLWVIFLYIQKKS